MAAGHAGPATAGLQNPGRRTCRREHGAREQQSGPPIAYAGVAIPVDCKELPRDHVKQAGVLSMQNSPLALAVWQSMFTRYSNARYAKQVNSWWRLPDATFLRVHGAGPSEDQMVVYGIAVGPKGQVFWDKYAWSDGRTDVASLLLTDYAKPWWKRLLWVGYVSLLTMGGLWLVLYVNSRMKIMGVPAICVGLLPYALLY
jgi:hypothetical protein